MQLANAVLRWTLGRVVCREMTRFLCDAGEEIHKCDMEFTISCKEKGCRDHFETAYRA